MRRVFLDANVLFSAAYRPDAPLRRLWTLRDVELVTSAYAAAEAIRNLTAAQQRFLEPLLAAMTVLDEAPDTPLPNGVALPPKDVPILRSAIACGASYLLTGDKTHFGPLYGRTLAGVRVLPPGEFLSAWRPRR